MVVETTHFQCLNAALLTLEITLGEWSCRIAGRRLEEKDKYVYIYFHLHMRFAFIPSSNLQLAAAACQVQFGEYLERAGQFLRQCVDVSSTSYTVAVSEIF